MENIIQVAGIIDSHEAEILLEEGVDWLGFPLRLPSGKDDILESAAKAIIQDLSPPNLGVLISYMTRADDVVEFCDALGVKGVQLHGDISVSEMIKLRVMRPRLCILKSLVVKSNNLSELLSLVDDCSQCVDMFITDTFDPMTGAKGATGLTHDWGVSAELARRSSKPLMLAGGLTPENIAQAILTVRPAAVDAHSKLEGEDRRKDRHKVRTFVSEARRAFAELNSLKQGQ